MDMKQSRLDRTTVKVLWFEYCYVIPLVWESDNDAEHEKVRLLYSDCC